MTPDTIFPIASVAKPIAAYAAAVLAEEGKLDLDRPVRMYLPAFDTSDAIVTLGVTTRDLLAHRSGFGKWWFLQYNNHELPRSALLAKLPHLRIAAPFRTTFIYSNIGYAIAGEVISKAADMPFERVVEDRVFSRLGMTRTTYSRQKAEADVDHMAGVIWIDGQYVPVPMEPSFNLLSVGRGIYSTATDVAKWLRVEAGQGRTGEKVYLNSAVLAEAHRLAVPIHSPDNGEFAPEGYALGWFRSRLNGREVLSHGGGTWGVTAEATIVPEERLAVIVLANQDSSRFPNALTKAILDRLTGSSARDWTGDALKQHRAMLEDRTSSWRRSQKTLPLRLKWGRRPAELVGIYSHPGFGAVEVINHGGRLRIKRGREVADLVSLGALSYRANAGFTSLWAPEGEAATITFQPDSEGRIAALKISSAEGHWFARAQD